MCGIAGILYKHGEGSHKIGGDLVKMLDGCQHRGLDSTGFALYGAADGKLKMRFLVGKEGERDAAIAAIKKLLTDHNATIVTEEILGLTYKVSLDFKGDVQKFTYDVEHAAKLFSVGHALDIIKDEGTAHSVDDIYHVSDFVGSHGIGHVRLATESAVKPESAHPFLATGFEDIAIVHNGQITNYWKMRRRLERQGYEFHTDNDSELIAVYLGDKLIQQIPLTEALQTAIADLDGTFSFLVSTRDEMGYAKDNLAAKPMVMFETDDLVAIASEEVSLNRLFPGQALSTTEPAPGTYKTWSRSI